MSLFVFGLKALATAWGERQASCVVGCLYCKGTARRTRMKYKISMNIPYTSYMHLHLHLHLHLEQYSYNSYRSELRKIRRRRIGEGNVVYVSRVRVQAISPLP